MQDNEDYIKSNYQENIAQIVGDNAIGEASNEDIKTYTDQISGRSYSWFGNTVVGGTKEAWDAWEEYKKLQGLDEVSMKDVQFTEEGVKAQVYNAETKSWDEQTYLNSIMGKELAANSVV